MKTILIAGGGAAGLMAAISASGPDRRVIVLEKNDRAGKKLSITGKGRCNITTSASAEEFFDGIVTNPRFLYSSFAAFDNEAVIRFFNQAGLKTKVERGKRVFPESDRATDVIRILLQECRKRKVQFRYHCQVVEVLLDESACSVSGKEGDKEESSKEKKTKKVRPRVRGVRLKDGEILSCDALILACGGRSYPATGSDGSGYLLAQGAGHRIRDPQPSLVPFVMEEGWCKDLSGLTLKNVSIRVRAGKKNVFDGFGELLFTHFGLSGPLVLTASTMLGAFQKELKNGTLTLSLDMKPALDPDQLDRRFLREFDVWRNKKICNVIERMLPGSFVPIFLDVCGIDPDKRVRDISKKERKHMVTIMKDFGMRIRGIRGFNEAIITRGGVDVKEVDPKTMESRKAEGLFIAGEMLDVDAVTGGYNLQIAWSTGWAAGAGTERKN